MTTTEPLVFNPLDPAFRLDPYPVYRRLLEEEPVNESALGALVFSRTAPEEMEVGGATIKKGRQSVLLLAAANRDPELFENPDTLDITRADNRHLAFGFGIHACLGARLEGEIAFRRLRDRFEGLQLMTDAPEYRENIVLRGLASLPVSFTRPASG